MAQIAAIGEVMVELSPFPSVEANGRELMALSFAGDTFNTAVYMARLGLQTDYVTKLGDDPYSQQILSRAASENLGTRLIERLPGRSPGLYIIRNTPDGEREFFYWRKEAPARELFSSAEAVTALTDKLSHYQCVYLSGITLAIIGETGRANLQTSLKTLRDKGVTIAFDSNFRPRLWRDKAEAQAAMIDVMAHTQIALLTLDDEQLLWGDNTIDGCIKRYSNIGIEELVLKRGAEDTVIVQDGKQTRVPVPPVINIVDTTGAGDTFNAGYLATRLNGGSPVEAAQQATRCAGVVIRHRGGVIDGDIFRRELGL